MPLLQRKRYLNLNHAGVYAPAPGGGGLGLQTSLTGFWSMENTSWLDDTASGTTLTGTGSPSTTTGKVGNAASLTASTSYLQAASNTNVSAGGGSFSVQAWVNISNPPGTKMLFSKSLNTFGNYEWGLGTTFTSANVWEFSCTNTSTTHFGAVDTVGVATNTWVHLVGTYDSGSKVVTLYKNGTSVATATLTGTLNSSASAPLNFGYNGFSIATVNILIDQCGFWKGRILSAGDVTALYNSGSGLSYAAMA